MATKTKDKKKSKGGGDVEAYCMKCQKKRVMIKVKKITMKNGRPARKGECPKCGTGMFRIGE